jgi:hypothetical protein
MQSSQPQPPCPSTHPCPSGGGEGRGIKGEGEGVAQSRQLPAKKTPACAEGRQGRQAMADRSPTICRLNEVNRNR